MPTTQRRILRVQKVEEALLESLCDAVEKDVSGLRSYRVSEKFVPLLYKATYNAVRSDLVGKSFEEKSCLFNLI